MTVEQKDRNDMYNKLSRTRSAAILLATISLATVSPAIADNGLDATDDVFWPLTAEVNNGQEDAFFALMADMVAATKAETGAKSYEWFHSGNQVQILERYETNGDAGIHLASFGTNFADRFMTVLTPTGLQVYGPAQGAVRDGLAAFGAEFNDQVGGFARD